MHPDPHHAAPDLPDIRHVEQTTCCVVGAGPAGIILSYLLARRGIPVTLLEAHQDFDRDFRGDTIHPSTLEMLDRLGLAEELLRQPHGKLQTLRILTPTGSFTVGDMRHLRTRFPYIMMMPQSRFLDYMAAQARQWPSFRLVLGANVQRLIWENGTVRGVRYRGDDDQWHEVRSTLTVAADGRFSKVRSLADLEPIKTSPPMDVLWFRLPRKPEDVQDEGFLVIHGGHFMVVLDRGDQWQLGFIILKGTFAQMRAGGLPALRQSIAETLPWLRDRVDLLHDWKQIAVLSVESNRLKRWYRPGLLLIGDAAHAMSPVGGVGINYAIQDAVEAANQLAEPLRQGHVTVQDLARVQRRRAWIIWLIQRGQAMVQDRIAAPALQQGKAFRLPLALRILLFLPVLRTLPSRVIGFGIWPVRPKV